jgi:hypothetical protein
VPDPRAALLAEARRRHGDIRPCASRATLEDCFTTLPSGEAIFWFNLPSGTTAVLRESSLKAELAELPISHERAKPAESPYHRERAERSESPSVDERAANYESPACSERAV